MKQIEDGATGAMKVGFQLTVEHFRKGVLIDREVIKNIVPTEGLTYILEAALRGGTAYSSWYVPLFEGNYTPVGTVTADTFPAAATECTAYAEATRVAWITAAAAAGVVTNAASKATFTMNATKSIYGLAISSVSTKGATTGVLISVARFAAVKSVVADDVLTVTAPISMASS